MIDPADYDRWRTAWRDGDDPDQCADCNCPEYDDDGPCCELILCDDGEYRCEQCAQQYDKSAQEEEE